MKKNTSAKQIAANRRNALKSTGPRTRKGRSASRMNALKHGILSTQVLLQGAFLEESEEEFKALHRRFQEDLQPRGPLEEMLMDQVVTAHWRLRRVLRAEAGEVTLNVESRGPWRDFGFHPALQWAKWTAFGDPVLAMTESSLGNALLIDWLSQIRDAVEAEGILTEAAVRQLADHLRGKPSSLVDSLDEFRKQMDAAAQSPNPMPPEQRKTETLEFLRRQIQCFKNDRECRAMEEADEKEARREAALIPATKALDKILRYETKLERQMFRAMLQLERVQRLRKGDSVPAPLAVHIMERA